jgi:hypothetical protein
MTPYQPQLPMTQLTLAMMPLTACWLLGALCVGAWWWAWVPNGKRGER